MGWALINDEHLLQTRPFAEILLSERPSEEDDAGV